MVQNFFFSYHGALARWSINIVWFGQIICIYIYITCLWQVSENASTIWHFLFIRDFLSATRNIAIPSTRCTACDAWSNVNNVWVQLKMEDIVKRRKANWLVGIHVECWICQAASCMLGGRKWQLRGNGHHWCIWGLHFPGKHTSTNNARKVENGYW